MTVKNRYPLPLINEIVDRVQRTRLFSKTDLQKGLVDEFYIVYLDDILFSPGGRKNTHSTYNKFASSRGSMSYTPRESRWTPRECRRLWTGKSTPYHRSEYARAPVLRHFDPQRPSKVETDASDGALGCIYSQLFEDGWHPVAFYSRQFKGPEINYGTPDKEMYSIVEAFRHWRHYLEGSRHTIEVWTDHQNLQAFMKQQRLNGRQARWCFEFTPFDFTIRNRKGISNPADGPSRRPDYVRNRTDAGDRSQGLLMTLGAKFARVQQIQRIRSIRSEDRVRENCAPAEEWVAHPSYSDFCVRDGSSNHLPVDTAFAAAPASQKKVKAKGVEPQPCAKDDVSERQPRAKDDVDGRQPHSKDDVGGRQPCAEDNVEEQRPQGRDDVGEQRAAEPYAEP